MHFANQATVAALSETLSEKTCEGPSGVFTLPIVPLSAWVQPSLKALAMLN